MQLPEGYVVGWATIAQRLGVGCTDTAKRYSRRKRDPLPVLWWITDPVAKGEKLDAWRRRALDKDPALEKIVGWQAIADAIGRSVDAAQRWAAKEFDALPVVNIGKPLPKRQWIYVEALRDWYDRQCIPFTLHDRFPASLSRRGRARGEKSATT